MLVLSAEQISRLVSQPALIDAIAAAFACSPEGLDRAVVKLPGAHEDRQLLMMPAFDGNGGTVKLVTVSPRNDARGLATIQGAIVVFAEHGAPIALLDGTIVTHLRTAAASALASRYLSREDSAHLAIIGTGALAFPMARAHSAVRQIRKISIWGRRSDRARAVERLLRQHMDPDIEILLPESVENAVRSADIVTCATSSSTPIVSGRWLKPGSMLDVVGSFSPSRREVDDDAVLKSRIFVDTFHGAWSEAGDILDPISRGIISRENVEGELADLVCGSVCGRRSRDEITLFKSVGAAIEDLAAARHILAAHAAETPVMV